MNTKEKIISYGSIQGRHEMPVDGYLLPANAAELHGFHGGMKAAAEAAAIALVAEQKPTVVKFYPTGLTIAVIGAIKGFVSTGVKLIIMSFDQISKDYVEVEYND